MNTKSNTRASPIAILALACAVLTGCGSTERTELVGAKRASGGGVGLRARPELESQTGASTTGPVGRMRARITGGPSVTNGTNILTAPLRVNSAAQDSRFVVAVQLVTSSTLNLITTPYVDGVAQVASRTTSPLNGGTALTAGKFYTGAEAFTFDGVGVQPVVTGGVASSAHTYYEDYQLQLGTSSVISKLIVMEWYGGNTMARSGGGSSSGGGSVTWPLTATNYLDMDGSDIRNSGDLAAKSNVYGITGFGTITFPTGGSGGPHIVGPSDDGFAVTAGAGRSLNLYADNGNGSSIQVASDGHIELNAAGTNKDIQLTPSGTGKVVVGPVRGRAGAQLSVCAPASQKILVRADNGSGGGFDFYADGSGSILTASNQNLSLEPDGTGITTTTKEISAPKLATGHIYRLPVSYGSATTVTVGAGSARSALDDANIVLASDQTVDITATGSLGLNTLTSARTFTTNGTATVTASGDVLFSDLSSNNRTLTGTFATTTTTLTGTASKLLSEIAVGDVVRVGAEGAGRITAVTSDTSATFVATLPDDAGSTGMTAYVNEGLTFKVGSETAFMVNTINNAGTTIVMSGSAAGTASGQSAKWDVEVLTGQWLYAYAAMISGSGRAFLSTHRTPAPNPITGLTAYRLIGSVRNDSSGNIVPFSCDGSGPTVNYTWECDSGGTFGLALRVVNGGTTDAAWHRIALTDAVPPGCGRVYCSSQVAASGTAFLRPSGVGDAAAARRNFVLSPAAGQMSSKPFVQLYGGAFDYATDQALYLDVYGFDFQR